MKEETSLRLALIEVARSEGLSKVATATKPRVASTCTCLGLIYTFLDNLGLSLDQTQDLLSRLQALDDYVSMLNQELNQKPNQPHKNDN